VLAGDADLMGTYLTGGPPVTTLFLHKTTTTRHFGFNAGDWLVFLLGLALACSLVMLI
jgi:hypothetical protein